MQKPPNHRKKKSSIMLFQSGARKAHVHVLETINNNSWENKNNGVQMTDSALPQLSKKKEKKPQTSRSHPPARCPHSLSEPEVSSSSSDDEGTSIISGIEPSSCSSSSA